MIYVKRRFFLILFAIFLATALLFLHSIVGFQSLVQSAQTGEPASEEVADLFTKAACIGCHTIPGVPNAIGDVGPNLSAIGLAAGDRISGVSAEDYIRESILNPAAFIAPQCPLGDCPANVMPPNMADRLTSEEIDQVVDYLLSLKGEGVPEIALFDFKPIPIERPLETMGTPFAEPPKQYEDAQIVLGKYLFYDTRLSADTLQSCASCHSPEKAWTDGQALNDGYTGTGYFRNAPTVMNSVFRDRLYWDGRLDGNDMPTLVRDHITEAHFMNSDGRLMVERMKQVPEYVQLFDVVYGKEPSFGGVLNAITAYVHSINSGITPYDQYLAGDSSALNEDATVGMALFESHCASCHSGSLLSDGEYHHTAVSQNDEIWLDPLRHITFRRFFRQLGTPNYRNLTEDVGLYALTKEDGDWGAFLTPSLREVSRTAPYMHNGTLSTLEEVVRFYNETQSLDLTETEITQIVIFLEQLSSEEIVVEPVSPPDYQLRTLGENR